MGIAATGHNKNDPFASGSLLQRFRSQFQWGRKTLNECSWNTGRMPNPVNGCDGLMAIFHDYIYKG